MTVVRAWLAVPAYGGYFAAPIPGVEREQRQDVEQLLKATRHEFPEVEVGTRVVNGTAVPALIEASNGARLVVVGTKRHHGPLSIGAGYVVQGLLSHAQTPVAVVPTS